MRPTRGLSSLVGVAFVAAAMCIGSADQAAAATFWLETNISVNLGCDPFTPGSCLSDDDPVDIELWGPTPDPGGISQGSGFITLDQVYGSPGELLTVSAAADSSFGQLQVRAAAEYDLTGVSSPEYRFVAASAQTYDELTINSGLLNGTAGLFKVDVNLDGEISSSGSALAGALLNISWDSSVSHDGETNFAFVSNGLLDQGASIFIPIVYGDPFALSMWLGAVVGTAEACTFGEPCDFGVNLVAQDTIGSGSSNFFSTLRITGLTPLDAFGNPVSDATFSSASNTRYTREGVEDVPEPATLLLLGSGLAMGLRRFRRSAR